MVIHLLFVAFVAFGAFAVVWRPSLAWAHLPVASYGVAISLFQWTCPLTPLEWRLRARAGQSGYAGGFIEHYLLAVLYPGAPPGFFTVLGVSLFIGSALVYIWAWRRHARRRSASQGIQSG